MNTIRRLGHRLVRSPGTRTVRARLTLMYSALLLAFGAALLAVTVVLWGKATRGTVFKAPGTALQVLRIPAPKSRMSRFGAVTRSAKLPPTIRHQIIQVNIYLDHVAASQHLSLIHISEPTRP